MSNLDDTYYQMLWLADHDHYLCARPEEYLRDFTWDDAEFFNNQPLDTSGYDRGPNVTAAITDFLEHCEEEMQKFGLDGPSKHQVVFVAAREARTPEWITYRYEVFNNKPATPIEGGVVMRYTQTEPKETEQEELEALEQEGGDNECDVL